MRYFLNQATIPLKKQFLTPTQVLSSECSWLLYGSFEGPRIFRYFALLEYIFQSFNLTVLISLAYCTGQIDLHSQSSYSLRNVMLDGLSHSI